MHSFTKEDIKNSIEYRWRIYQKNFVLIIFGILSGVTVITLFISFIIGLKDMSFSNELLKIFFTSVLIMELIYTSCTIPFVLYYLFKAKSFLNNYSTYKYYEVTLDSPSTSYTYRNTVYYTVTITDDNGSLKVDTNPYFSSSIFSKFDIKEYNNKKVIGLYDEDGDKFYIINKA